MRNVPKMVASFNREKSMRQPNPGRHCLPAVLVLAVMAIGCAAGCATDKTEKLAANPGKNRDRDRDRVQAAPVQPTRQATPKAARQTEVYFTDISVEKARDMIQKNRDNERFVVLDVRTPREYRRGHISGAVLLDIRAAAFKTDLGQLERENTYLVHCARGGRSAKATALMKQLGFKKVHHMPGGMNAWQAKGFATRGK